MKKLTCIVCPKGCDITVDTLEIGFDIKGYQCVRGKEYALSEITNPKRSLTSTVKTVYKVFPRLPVRTDTDIKFEDIFPVMEELNRVEINHPVHSGEIVVSNILETGVNIIATCDMFDMLEGV